MVEHQSKTIVTWYMGQYFTYWIASVKRFNQLQVITWVSGLPFINSGFSPSTNKYNSTWRPLVENEKSLKVYYKFIIIQKSCYSVGVAIICVLFVFSLFLYSSPTMRKQCMEILMPAFNIGSHTRCFMTYCVLKQKKITELK